MATRSMFDVVFAGVIIAIGMFIAAIVVAKPKGNLGWCRNVGLILASTCLICYGLWIITNGFRGARPLLITAWIGLFVGSRAFGFYDILAEYYRQQRRLQKD